MQFDNEREGRIKGNFEVFILFDWENNDKCINFNLKILYYFYIFKNNLYFIVVFKIILYVICFIN